jgi:hypothetical protein
MFLKRAFAQNICCSARPILPGASIREPPNQDLDRDPLVRPVNVVNIVMVVGEAKFKNNSGLPAAGNFSCPGMMSGG